MMLQLQIFARFGSVFALSLSVSAGYAAYKPAFTEVLDFNELYRLFAHLN